MKTVKNHTTTHLQLNQMMCCNALNVLSNKVCVPNKTEDLNLSMINKLLEKMNQRF